MRNYTLNIRLAAVMVAPLLLACGSDNQGGGTTYVTVPDCGGATNQVLSTDSTGQLVCRSLPAGAVSLPDCKPNTEALTSDGVTPTCTNRDVVDASTQTLLDTLTMVEKQIVDAGTKITALGSGPSSQAAYVGLTKNSYTGRFVSGQAVGIPAATALCAGDFGVGAHMCTVYELYYSAALLKNLDPTVDISPGGWVYMQSWRHAPVNPTEISAGLADNCAGYTYTFAATDTYQWNGTTFAWTVDASGVRVPKFYANTQCNTSQPIACCR
ncbi:MAG TPA: hypothetical protein PLW65_05830 [Pseudomonadota bacterium]|nr:hypothetical protein [Pseudomonadota bacterium]